MDNVFKAFTNVMGFKPETYFLHSPPTVQVISTTVSKAIPRDLIIHTIKLSHEGHEWYVTVQRTGLRELYKKLKAWEILTKSVRAYQKYQRSVTKGRTAFKGKSKGATPSSPDGNTRDLTDVVLGDASPSPSSSPPPLPSASTLHNPLHATPPSPAPRKTLKQSTETLRRSLSEHGRELGGTDKLTTSTGTNSKFTVSFGANENANNLASSISFNAEDGTAAEPASDSESDDSDPEDTNAAEYDGVTKFNVSKEVTAANRRLKKYQLLFISPQFYRTDAKSLQKQRNIVESYLIDALAHPRNRMCPEFLAFLEVSAMSFLPGSGPSLMEGMVNIRCSADTSDRALRKRENRACCGRSGGCHCVCCVCFCFRKRFTVYKKQKLWAVLKPGSFSVYTTRTDVLAQECIMFQPSTVVADQLGTTGSMNGALIVDTAWMAELKFDNKISQNMWSTAIKGAVTNCPYVSRNRFQYESNSTNSLLSDEFGSHTCHAQWFVNGQAYYSHLYDALNKAKQQVLLSGWFLSPDTYLKRPISQHPDSRLDMIIEKACQRGVKRGSQHMPQVYIMVFHEPPVMAHNTTYCRDRFLELDHKGNLFFQRHGDPNIPYFWSHHDKHVTIDQETAFLGGIDITFGRYETSEYRLRDDDPNVQNQLFPGADYGNPRIGDVDNPELPMQDNAFHDRERIARMPWRDIHGCVKGTVALDVAWHFIQRWNYTRYVNKDRKVVPAILPSGLGSLALSWLDRKDNVDAGVVDNPRSQESDDMRATSTSMASPLEMGGHSNSSSPWSLNAKEQKRRASLASGVGSKGPKSGRRSSLGGAIGSRVVNFMRGVSEEGSFNAELDSDDVLVVNPYDPNHYVPSNAVDTPVIPQNVTKATRMSMMYAKDAGGEMARSFKNAEKMPGVLAGASTKKQDKKVNVASPDFAARTSVMRMGHTGEWGGAAATDERRPASRRVSIADMLHDHSHTPMPETAPMLAEWGKDLSGESSHDELKTMPYSNANSNDFVQCKCQIVRSYSRWSSGLSDTDDGIQEAYKQLISGAQHFIYMENQFFVSACGEKDNVIGNTVVNCLFARILRAHAEGAQFKVLISIPLLPGMNGAVKGDGLSGIACILHFQFRTISQGGNSLFERLRRHNIDPDDYVFITGLRTHQEFKHSIETEMVYIHSKLMIVDDRKAVMGSANINDRSMMGYKDSEICVIVEDTLHVAGKMNGKPFKAGPFARGLRLKTWGDNLGLSEAEYGLIDDPNCEATWDMILKRARKNTDMYELAFPGLTPSNAVSSLHSLFKTTKESDDLMEAADLVKKENLMAELTSRGQGKGAHGGEAGWGGTGVGGWGTEKPSSPTKKVSKAVHSDTVGVPLAKSNSENLKKQALRKKMARLSKTPSIRITEDGNVAAGPDLGDGDLPMSTFAQSNPMARAKGKKKKDNSGGVKDTLSKIKGILCEYPLDFLKDDFTSLKTTMIPSEIFK